MDHRRDHSSNHPGPTSPLRRHYLRAGAAVLGLPWAAGLPAVALAQDGWPNRPIRMIVPYPAGGVVDVVVRAVMEKVAQQVGQPIIVENKPGASANIGTETMLRAPADGYTMSFGSPFLVTNPVLLTSTKWKTTDFAGVSLIGAPPNVFVAATNVPVKTMRDMVEYVKARPGQVNVTNPGTGTSNHLGQELLFSLTGMQMENISYKGQPEMLIDLLSGQVSFGLVTLTLAGPHIREGKLRALAVSAPKRVPSLPDVPTIAEAGYAGAMFLPWYGIVASAQTPRPIIRRMSDEIQRALKDAEVAAKLEQFGTFLTPGSGEEFDKLIESETKRWAQLIKERNIKPVG